MYLGLVIFSSEHYFAPALHHGLILTMFSNISMQLVFSAFKGQCCKILNQIYASRDQLRLFLKYSQIYMDFFAILGVIISFSPLQSSITPPSYRKDAVLPSPGKTLLPLQSKTAATLGPSTL